MAPIIISICNRIFKAYIKKMTEGLIVGFILLGLLIYGILTDFDDGSGYDKFE